MYSIILFDLDGTLMNTSPGIFDTANYTMGRLGLPPVPDRQLRKFVGPPLKECFKVACRLDDSLIPEACAIYRERYDEKGRFMAEVYDGMLGLLETLRTQGRRIAVATLKHEQLAKEVLEYFKLSAYFDEIVGADLDGVRTKAGIIDLALERLGWHDKSRTLMIGDTPHDLIGAQAAGVDLLAVDYGFGFPRGVDLSAEPGVVGVAGSPAAILPIITGRE
ncbi:MAG: HAD-IA family hydrolase [Sphaerochaetaceae bacterium]|nr:HAD-IA family hydrolase [Sphaerochaetaceae bacterium]